MSPECGTCFSGRQPGCCVHSESLAAAYSCYCGLCRASGIHADRAPEPSSTYFAHLSAYCRRYDSLVPLGFHPPSRFDPDFAMPRRYNFQRGYRRRYTPLTRRSAGMHSSLTVHKKHELQQIGPGEQYPFSGTDLTINQGFIGSGAGRTHILDEGTSSGGYLLIWSPTARRPSTTFQPFPETLRLEQRHSTNVLVKGLRENVNIRFQYNPPEEDDEPDEEHGQSDRIDSRSQPWRWRRVVIRSKNGAFQDIGSGTDVDGLYAAIRLFQGRHVRPVVPIENDDLVTAVSEHLFKPHADGYVDGFYRAVVDTDNHRVLYDDRKTIFPGRGGDIVSYTVYHAFNFMFTYDDARNLPAGENGWHDRQIGDEVPWGDVYVFDWFEQPEKDPHTSINVNIQSSTFYWHERPL